MSKLDKLTWTVNVCKRANSGIAGFLLEPSDKMAYAPHLDMAPPFGSEVIVSWCQHQLVRKPRELAQVCISKAWISAPLIVLAWTADEISAPTTSIS